MEMGGVTTPDEMIPTYMALLQKVNHESLFFEVKSVVAMSETPILPG
jgi:hypothetical protein